MDYFLGIERKKIERIRKLTEEEIKEIQNAAKPILLYTETMDLFRMVELNYIDLLNGFDRYRRELITSYFKNMICQCKMEV